tara:strand:- start:632 stop:853 length:222 start_codon:yes stop_codon:yes gene_type:complete
MSKPKEGNILSYKILLDNKGNLVTEFSGLPLEKVHTVFKGNDVRVIKKLIQEGSVHLESLHDRLQKEIQAIST